MTLFRLYQLLLIVLLMTFFIGLLVFFTGMMTALMGVIVTAGPVLVLWAIGMAFAGAGNRLVWTGIFLMLTVISALLLQQISPAMLDKAGVVGGILGCAAVPLVPAFFLWTATVLRRRRARFSLAPAGTLKKV